MKKKYSKLYLIVLIIVLFISIEYLFLGEKDDNNFFNDISDDVISFGLEDGFYYDDIKLSLKKTINAPIGSKIYYTINGDDPKVNSNKYNSPIILTKKNDVNVYSIKASVCLKYKCTKAITKTYIILSDNAKNMNIDIVNITSDYHSLYDYSYGIIAKGKSYDEDLAKGATGYIKGNYANRGDEWLRNATVKYFSSDGELLYNDHVLFGVSGGTSAANYRRSYKIVNKENNVTIRGINNSKISDTSIVYEPNSIKFRGNAQDWEYGNIRSSLMTLLSIQSNFDGVSTTKRALLYLNGGFIGIYDVEQDFSKNYLRKKYSLKSSGIINKYSASEKIVLSVTNLYEYFNNDLSNIENIKLLEEHVDMDNFLLYYAINILTNNTDWPQNNFGAWYYDGEKNSNKYTDGRLRFFIKDPDIIYYTENNYQYFDGCFEDTFVSLMEQKYRAYDSVFKNVISSKYYRDKFVTIVSDLLNTSFKKENIYKIIDSEFSKINTPARIIVGNDYVNESEKYINYMKEAVDTKEETIKQDFYDYFSLDEKYNFNIFLDEGISASFGNTKLFGKESYNNDYYKNVEFDININSYPGYNYKYTLINGIKYYDNVITISDELIVDDKIEIEIISEKIKNSVLVISEVSSKNVSDWIKITNVGGKKASLKNYYISDNKKNLKKYNLPDIKLNSNESILINAKNNYFALGDYICNFNIKNEETIYLTDTNDNIIDKMFVPKMEKYESYGRYLNSNSYIFYDNYNNDRKNSN